METSTLRPGLLVSIKTSTRGNIAYIREVLESDRATADGASVARWETQRTIADPAEYERATKVRAKARSLVSSICAQSAFGLLCPNDRAEKLEAAMRDARKLVAEFNSTAGLTRISLYVLVGHIASDDAEAAKAIASEMRDLIDAMTDGVKNLDVKTIREAASKAKSVGQMLTPEAQARIQLAVDTVRSTARQIVAAGEQAAQEVDMTTVRRLAEVRTAFLDLDDAKEIGTPAVAGRAVDFAPIGA